MRVFNIFADSLEAPARKYLQVFAGEMRLLGYSKVVVPCAGQFGAVLPLIKAGYAPQDIYASDISIFSAILGYYYSNKPLESLPIVIGELYEIQYLTIKTESFRAAYLLILLKISQLRDTVAFERGHKVELVDNIFKYAEQLEKKLIEYKHVYDGINYEIRDLRTLLEPHKNEWIVMDAPETKSKENYTTLHYEAPEHFNYLKEFEGIWANVKQSETPILWYTSKEDDYLKPNRVSAAQIANNGKFSYWLFSAPKLLEGIQNVNIVMPATPPIPPVYYELFPASKEITKETKIKFFPISSQTALYYRDLFAHKLGASTSETYYGIFADGKLMTVCGFNMSDIRKLQCTFIFCSFAMTSPHDKYENFNRLSLLLTTCSEFKKMVLRTALKSMRFVELTCVRSVCITKRRTSGLHNGIFKLLQTDKMDNGQYKLLYEANFRKNSTYAQCVEEYLDKEMRLKKQ